MTLFKTSALSLIATLFKISYGLVLSKLLAIYVGPSGLVLVGQFQSVQSGLAGLATAGFGQGLTKYLSEYRGDVEKSSAIFATAIKLVCVILIPLSLTLFFLSESISQWVFGSASSHLWMKVLAVSLIPSSLGAIFVSSLNGLGEIRSLTMVGVMSSVLGIILSFILVPVWGVSGVIGAIVTTPFLVLLMSIRYLKKSSDFSWHWLKEKSTQSDGKKLGAFTLMALTSAVTIPLSHILIRNILTDTVSIEAAGLWTGMWRISEAYLMVVTMTLSVYYLPKLSGLKNQCSIKNEIKYGQRIIIPFVLASSLLVFFMRDLIILVLFNDDFSEMRELFAFQLLGDVLKISSWLYSYILIAKSKVKAFVIFEIMFNFVFVFLVLMLVKKFGVIGATYAFFISYILYLFSVYFWFQKSCNNGIFDE
ncbi:MAG: O-antigen translocase [Methylococcaceae bacterium]